MSGKKSIPLERLSSLFQREISLILQKEIKDANIGYVTITEVRITKDLSFATVFYTLLGEGDQLTVTQEALEKAKGFIRSELAKKVEIRKIPDLIFKADTSLQTGNTIEKILSDIK